MADVNTAFRSQLKCHFLRRAWPPSWGQALSHTLISPTGFIGGTCHSKLVEYMCVCQLLYSKAWVQASTLKICLHKWMNAHINENWAKLIICFFFSEADHDHRNFEVGRDLESIKPSQLVCWLRMGPERRSHRSTVIELTSRTQFWTQR